MQTFVHRDDRIANPAPAGEATGVRWRLLYRAAAAAALITAVFIPIQVAVFLFRPPPLDSTAADWFTLLRNHRLAGLVDLDLLLVADNVLLIPILLALYVALRQASASVVVTAVALGLVGVVMYLASNPAIAMATLSDQYAAATTEAQRATAVAAGEVTLAMWQGTAFQTAYLLGSAAGLGLGAVMLRSGPFGKPTGWLAIVANTVGLGLYVPGVGVFIAVFSVVFLEAWYVLLARRLHQLSRRASAAKRTSCTRSIRTCCRRGTPSATCAQGGGRLNGWSTTRWSTTTWARVS